MVDTETREELRQSARNARLEALESDNYQEEVTNDDEEYVDLVDDDGTYSLLPPLPPSSFTLLFSSLPLARYPYALLSAARGPRLWILES